MNPSAAGDDGMVEILDLSDEIEARAAARSLVEHGIGADVAPQEGEGTNLITGTGERYLVKVLADDEVRAREILGLPEPEPESDEPDESDESDQAVGSVLAGVTDDKKVHSLLGGRINATSKQIAVAVAIYLLALILLPLAAFYSIQVLLDDDVTSVVEAPDE